MNKIIIIWCFSCSISSCVFDSEIRNTIDEMDEIMENSKSTIDSALNDINRTMNNLNGKFDSFERDSTIEYNEVILEYEKE